MGNEALKKVNEILSIDEVEQILDETRESIEKQQEIDALLNGVLSEEDEDEVLAELDALVASEEGPEKTPEDIGVRLPDVPEDDPVAAAEKKRKEKGNCFVDFVKVKDIQRFLSGGERSGKKVALEAS